MTQSTPPVRFADGADDIVEGLAIPYGGPFVIRGRRDVDFYRTRFGPETDLCLDWFESRPVLYDHGQDGEAGHDVIGTVRTADITDYDDGTFKGKWVRAQLDKRAKYFDEIRAMVKAGQLGWSHGTLEYLMDVDRSTGDVRTWPLIEHTLTPREANLDAPAAMRSVDPVVLRLLGTTEEAIAVRGWLPEGTSEGDLDDGDFAWLASDKKLPDSQRRKLPYKVHGKVNEAGWKAAWSRAHQDGTDFSGGPDQAAVIKKLLADAPRGVSTKYDDGKETPPGGRSYRSSSAASDAASGAYCLASLLGLMGDEAGEDDQVAMLQEAADALKRWIDAEQAEIGQPGDDESASSFYSTTRAGARNSAGDQAHIDAAHANLAAAHGHLMAVGAQGHSPDEGAPGEMDDASPNDDTPPPDDESARSSPDLRPVVLTVMSDEEAARRSSWLATAAEIGRQEAAHLRR